jgi:hypothetical protein
LDEELNEIWLSHGLVTPTKDCLHLERHILGILPIRLRRRRKRRKTKQEEQEREEQNQI